MTLRSGKNEGVTKPRGSPSTREQQRELERSLETYSCVLKKDIAEPTRRLGLEQGLTTCAMAEKLIREGLSRARGEEGAGQ